MSATRFYIDRPGETGGATDLETRKG